MKTSVLSAALACHGNGSVQLRHIPGAVRLVCVLSHAKVISHAPGKQCGPAGRGERVRMYGEGIMHGMELENRSLKSESDVHFTSQTLSGPPGGAGTGGNRKCVPSWGRAKATRHKRSRDSACYRHAGPLVRARMTMSEVLAPLLTYQDAERLDELKRAWTGCAGRTGHNDASNGIS